MQLLSAWRYIERNPVDAHLVRRAELWEWSSAAHLIRSETRLRLDEAPIRRPREWLDIVNQEDPDLLMTAIERWNTVSG